MTTIALGDAAACSDGFRGQVRGVVIEPAAGTLTHVVIEPEGRAGLARLVPLGLLGVDADGAAAAGPLRLRCSEAEFMGLDPAEERLAEFAVGQTVPVQLIAPGWRGTGEPAAEGGDILRIPEQETIDVVPPGEVTEHEGDRVHATDGEIGRLQAFRIDDGTGRVTHVLLREGHLWARKQVAIPFDKVTGFDRGITLSISKRQVADLP